MWTTTGEGISSSNDQSTGTKLGAGEGSADGDGADVLEDSHREVTSALGDSDSTLPVVHTGIRRATQLSISRSGIKEYCALTA